MIIHEHKKPSGRVGALTTTLRKSRWFACALSDYAKSDQTEDHSSIMKRKAQKHQEGSHKSTKTEGGGHKPRDEKVLALLIVTVKWPMKDAPKRETTIPGIFRDMQGRAYLDDGLDRVSKKVQIFKSASLKSSDGRYPSEPLLKLFREKIIDVERAGNLRHKTHITIQLPPEV